jgi:alanine or glycine:cation symporter, AGCS family
LVICTITGLVILSSGAWTEKFENEFQTADLMLLDGIYLEQNENDRTLIAEYLANPGSNTVSFYSGSVDVVNGEILNPEFTVIHARSFADEVSFLSAGQLYSGQIDIVDGAILDPEISLRGKSLLHSAALTTTAFSFGLFGQNGQYIVTISLVLFAFSTAIAWSYYGDRAIIYLFGFKAVMPYRILYCFAFFIASFIDTTLVWNIAAVAIVLMTLPNLVGIMLMRKEMKALVNDYWDEYKK